MTIFKKRKEKKISIIGAISLTTTSAATAVSFTPVTHSVNVDPKTEEININIGNFRVVSQPN